MPPELIRQAAELGLFGLSIPEEYGGVGLGMLGRCAVYEALGQGHMGFGGMISAHASIGTSGLVKLGTPEQKQKYLPRMAAGECIAGFAITEPSSGSDAANIRTRAELRGDTYILNGTKHYISNAPIAGLLTVIAITDPAKGSKGMSAFLVEPCMPGVSMGKIDEKMGQKGALSAEVVFDNAEVPAENLLGPLDLGYREALGILTNGRVGIAARSTGAMQRLLDLSVAHAQGPRAIRCADQHLSGHSVHAGRDGSRHSDLTPACGRKSPGWWTRVRTCGAWRVSPNTTPPRRSRGWPTKRCRWRAASAT